MKHEIQKAWDAIDQLWEEEILFLKNIGSYKSILGEEKGVQDFIASYLEEMEIEVDSFDPDPRLLSKYKNFGKPEWEYKDRPVVNGTWKGEGRGNGNGNGNGKSLILQGHIDVVSSEPDGLWTYPPYEPRIVDGKMYGRGICDMKAGVTSMIFAIKSLKKAGLKPLSDIYVQTVTEEECTGNGALALLDKGYTADGAIIPEPFGESRLHAQVGVLWMRVKVFGAGAHVERADKAHNPINKAALLVQSLERYEKHINERRTHEDFQNHPHPLNVNTGMIHSGDWPSNVPSECVFDVRVGFYPDEDPDDIKEEVKEWLLNDSKKDDWLVQNNPEITFYGFSAPGSVVANESEVIYELEKAHRQVNDNELQAVNMPGTTDMRAFEEFGIPATCYGPKGEKMHAPDENIDLESVKRVTKTLAAFVIEWCAVKGIKE